PLLPSDVSPQPARRYLQLAEWRLLEPRLRMAALLFLSGNLAAPRALGDVPGVRDRGARVVSLQRDRGPLWPGLDRGAGCGLSQQIPLHLGARSLSLRSAFRRPAAVSPVGIRAARGAGRRARRDGIQAGHRGGMGNFRSDLRLDTRVVSGPRA